MARSELRRLEPAKSRYALSISGGGFAGLFAAEFLRRLEEDLGRPLGEVFDLYAGTSVGGLLALGLAHGKRASELSQMLGKIGPKLFGKPGLAIFKAKHDPAPLAAEARALFADKTLSQLTPRIVVPAVDMTAGRTRVFLNDSLNAKGASPWLFDVAMATSAAPTFLPPHRVDEQLFTDGGLVANSPEALAAMEMIHRLRWPAARTHLLVVGSTSVPARVPGYLAAQGWGKKDWLDDQTLLDLAMAGQMTLARQTAEAILGPGRVIVADVELSGRETEFVALDKADAKAAATLRGLAASAYATFSAQQAGFINRLRT